MELLSKRCEFHPYTEVTSRHALRGDLAYFLKPSEPPAFLVELANASDVAPPWPLVPEAGPDLCRTALQALVEAGAGAAAPYRDAIEVWRGYEVDARIADSAERLTGLFGVADLELKARVLAGGSGKGGGADDHLGNEEEAVDVPAPMVA